MLAKKYRSELVTISNPFEGIYTLEFKSVGKVYKYKPGQFLHIALDENYDGIGQWPESRCFSMQSNPDDSNIKITYAVKGKYTRQMEEQLNVGSNVWLKLPYGDLFTRPHSKEKTVFIAGGTGITPFLSLFTHKSFSEYTAPRIYIGFRLKEYNIYKEEIDSIIFRSSQVEKYFMKIFYENIDGILDIQTIFNENGLASDYFISGPPLMIKVFKETLVSYGVQVNHVFTDAWE